MKIKDYLKKTLSKNKINYIISITMLLLSLLFIYFTIKNSIIFIIFVIIFLIISITYLVTGIKYKNKIMKLYNSYSNETFNELEKELNNIVYNDEKFQTIYTKSYVFKYLEDFDIFKYKEIVWTYPYIIRHNGDEKEWNLTFITEDAKKHIVKNIEEFEKIDNDSYNDLTSYIHNINDEMVMGYTEENIELIKEQYNYENDK